jgi:hypothetical protein
MTQGWVCRKLPMEAPRPSSVTQSERSARSEESACAWRQEESIALLLVRSRFFGPMAAGLLRLSLRTGLNDAAAGRA